MMDTKDYDLICKIGDIVDKWNFYEDLLTELEAIEYIERLIKKWRKK